MYELTLWSSSSTDLKETFLRESHYDYMRAPNSDIFIMLDFRIRALQIWVGKDYGMRSVSFKNSSFPTALKYAISTLGRILHLEEFQRKMSFPYH